MFNLKGKPQEHQNVHSKITPPQKHDYLQEPEKGLTLLAKLVSPGDHKGKLPSQLITTKY